MFHRFTIKSTETSRKIQFKSQWFECEEFVQAIKKRDEYLYHHPEIDGCYCKWEEKEKLGRGGARVSPNNGGKREGAGRPKGTGKWGNESTSVKRVPDSIGENIEKVHKAIETLEGIIQAWELEIIEATKASITGKKPRTYDKAKQLLIELKEELNGKA